MSYCRCGEGSEVYVYGGATKYEVHFGVGMPDVEKKLARERIEPHKSFDTLQETYDFLVSIQQLGFEVPDYAFERMEEELDAEVEEETGRCIYCSKPLLECICE